MRKINQFYNILLAASFILLAGCADLDLEPEGSVFTEKQKEELTKIAPERLQAEVNGLYSGLIKCESITDWFGEERHYDFGFAAAGIMFDASGQDMLSENSGYNWFRNSMRYTDRTAPSDITYFLWNLFYSHLKTANNILFTVPADTSDPLLKAYRGQALASRAFDYLHLVQIYQFTYKGHESAPAVTIVTEETTPEQAANNPRATVQQVYDLIIKDLDEAISLLDGFARPGKEMIDQQVAYGLRARANLNMEKWADAASDAEKAMEGFTPYTIEDVSKPSFNDINASSWIWGSDVSENNDIVLSGILNFPAMVCSLTGNGYSPAYAGRYINKKLWEDIQVSDVRKGWWTEPVWGKDKDGKDSIVNYKTPLVDMTWTTTYNNEEYGVIDWFGWNAPYLNVKFGPYKNEYNNPTNACDLPLMRVEEMILIRAEALAMGGNPAQAKQVLENFVKTYRNPTYVCAASDAKGIQDEVWFQRRIELWGEGFSLFDVKRLKKPILRSGINFPEGISYNLPAEAPILLWLIPEDEVNANEAIDESTNNPVIAVPSV
ncbi:MAG: RagB/SusD family nutrient uptake outer membrane protein [Proteiniphilum sp.]|nr:RagB/SusD family nutrient uptake outer membrane protein [Proteiniphilum sp.]MDD4158077.1 RagB/SusD family nutrient uptake outer membrane protein [Proteiniphilum sp.]MDD4799576.1 RagB/SusD family nutrient uptake outer membrane protein [Proteiniphilum sp.]